MDTPNQSTPVSSNSAPSGDLYAALAYLPPLLFILTMIKKGDSPSHVWHAKNGAGVFVLAIGVNVVEQILVRTIGLYFLVPLLSLALVLLMLFAAWQAWNGKQFNIPVVTGIGQKIPLEKWFHKDAMGTATTPSPSPAAPSSATPAAAPVATPSPEAVSAPMPSAPVESPAAPVSMPAPAAVEAPETPMAPPAAPAEKPAEGSTPTTPTV